MLRIYVYFDCIGGKGSQLAANCIFFLSVLTWTVSVMVLCLGIIRILSPRSLNYNERKIQQKKIDEKRKRKKTEILNNEILKYSNQNKVTLAPRTGSIKDDSDVFFCKYGYSWDYVFVLPVPGTTKKGNSYLMGNANIETISLYNIEKNSEEIKNRDKGRDSNGGKEKEKEKEKERGKDDTVHDLSHSKSTQLRETKDRNGLFLFENPMKAHLNGHRDGLAVEFGVIDVSARSVDLRWIFYCDVLGLESMLYLNVTPFYNMHNT